jgi:hypothetical protein
MGLRAHSLKHVCFIIIIIVLLILIRNLPASKQKNPPEGVGFSVHFATSTDPAPPLRRTSTTLRGRTTRNADATGSNDAIRNAREAEAGMGTKRRGNGPSCPFPQTCTLFYYHYYFFDTNYLKTGIYRRRIENPSLRVGFSVHFATTEHWSPPSPNLRHLAR